MESKVDFLKDILNNFKLRSCENNSENSHIYFTWIHQFLTFCHILSTTHTHAHTHTIIIFLIIR